MDSKKRGFKLFEMASKKGKKMVSKEEIQKSKKSDDQKCQDTPKQKQGLLSKRKLNFEEVAEPLFESQEDIQYTDAAR